MVATTLAFSHVHSILYMYVQHNIKHPSVNYMYCINSVDSCAKQNGTIEPVTYSLYIFLVAN